MTYNLTKEHLSLCLLKTYKISVPLFGDNRKNLQQFLLELPQVLRS